MKKFENFGYEEGTTGWPRIMDAPHFTQFLFDEILNK